jgi:alkanesulfonate monooxygenase SsuD/methylene tetrahydromethanopterin reductase-like flavin-dependent oxidoreductase (luciferase family)
MVAGGTVAGGMVAGGTVAGGTVAHRIEFGVYIPQIAFSFDEMLQRAVLCEELGIDSFWMFDHLYAPGLPGYAAFEGWTLATALLARTSTLRVGHLVLDNNLRHPALLARMATTLDVISDGRLELGLGSGSYEAEHHEGGFPWGGGRERSTRLAESLEIVTRMFAGDPTTFEGEHYQVRGLPNLPRPTQTPRPPIHLGGVGERYTLPLAARYADVWNAPTYALDRWEAASISLDAECERRDRDPATLRRSLESVLVLAADEAGLAAARAVADRRYAGPAWQVEEGGFVGTPAAVVDRIGECVAKGITLFIFLPFDRGHEETLRLLATEVVPHFRHE